MRRLTKYQNRKIYDLDESRYVTLHQLVNLIRNGEDIKATEKTTGADITSEVLAAVILAAEQDRPQFPPERLVKVIRDSEPLVDQVA